MSDNHVAFRCDDVHVAIGEKQVVKGVTLTIKAGEIHALMGPNGSGKSTFANALMGHPAYTLTQGKIWVDGEDVTEAEADEKSRKGNRLRELPLVPYWDVAWGHCTQALLKSKLASLDQRSWNVGTIFTVCASLNELTLAPGKAVQWSV